MANLAFRAASYAEDVSFASGTATGTRPTGTAADDGLIAIVVSAAFAPAAPPTVTGVPTGWTQIGSDVVHNGINGGVINARHTFWRRVGESSEPATYAWTLSAAAAWAVKVGCWDNIRTSGSFVQSITSNTGTGTTATATGITTDETNQKLVGIFLSDALPTWTPPSGMTEQNDGNGSSITDEDFAAAGATGNKAATASASGAWQAYAVALYSEDSTSGGSTPGGPVLRGRVLSPGRIFGGSALMRQSLAWRRQAFARDALIRRALRDTLRRVA